MSELRLELDAYGNIKVIEIKDSKESAPYLISRLKEHIGEIQEQLKKDKQ